jgi:hypothetical protein
MSVSGGGKREEQVDGVLEGDGCGEEAEVGGCDDGVLGGGFYEDFADGEVLDEVRVDPAAVAGVGLFELDGAAWVDARDHAPAHVERLADAGFAAGEALGALVDPEAAFDAGEELGDHGGGFEVGVGAEVDDDLRRGDAGGLRLAGSEGVAHSRRHEADEAHDVGAGGGVALVVLDEVGGRGEGVEQALAFGGVFGGGERLAVALDHSSDGALAAFDDLAGGVAFGVDPAGAVAQREAAVVIDDVELVVGGGLDPVARRAGGRGRLRESGRGRLREGAARNGSGGKQHGRDGNGQGQARVAGGPVSMWMDAAQAASLKD